MSEARLEISVPDYSTGDELTVEYRVTAPEDSEVCFYNGPAEYIIDWDMAPGTCRAPEESFPLVQYYKAETELPRGVLIVAYEPPPVECIKAGAEHTGTFSVTPTVSRILRGHGGSAAEIPIEIPRRFRIQMVLGYNSIPPEVDPTDVKPIDSVLAWQKALTSNVLSIRRATCWTKEVRSDG